MCLTSSFNMNASQRIMQTNYSLWLIPLLSLIILFAFSSGLLVAPEGTETKFTSRLWSYKKRICSFCHTTGENCPHRGQRVMKSDSHTYFSGARNSQLTVDYIAEAPSCLCSTHVLEKSNFPHQSGSLCSIV